VIQTSSFYGHAAIAKSKSENTLEDALHPEAVLLVAEES
jgi:hypothetical protein